MVGEPGARRRRRLVPVQVTAGPDGVELVADPDRPGAWTLYVDGTPQSHVDAADPEHLEFEYVRWFARLLDAVAPAGRPLGVLHLGGGAWTLARYVAATRPGSRQRVVELDAELIRFVRERLPPAPPGIRVRHGEARHVLEGVRPTSVDVVVADAFAGSRVPAHLTSVEFHRAARRALQPGGVFAANLADGPPLLAFARAEVATARVVFGAVALVAAPQVLRGRRFGNLVLLGAAAAEELPIAALTRRLAADPFPARVVAGDDVERFAAGARPVTDADAVPSPEPPADWLDR